VLGVGRSVYWLVDMVDGGWWMVDGIVCDAQCDSSVLCVVFCI
jgi:hypothetical protein